MDITDYFDAYVKCGLQPLPLYPGTKIPMSKDWQGEWSLHKYRDIFQMTPNANMGVLLGQIIDVEGDDANANDRIFELTRNSPHPVFHSSKSMHHLFVSPDPKITVCKVGKIEFRGRRHQSAIPPSVHKNGTVYRWSKVSVFPPPPMPQRLADFLFAHRKEIKREKQTVNGRKSNHALTVCNKCHGKTYIHKKRLILEVRAFATLKTKWLCHECRPVDVRPICRTIRDQRDQDL